MTNLSELTTEQFEALRTQAYEAGQKGELPPQELVNNTIFQFPDAQTAPTTPRYHQEYTPGSKLGDIDYSTNSRPDNVINIYEHKGDRPTRPVLPKWDALVEFDNPVFRQAEAQSADRVRLRDLRNQFATGLMDLLSETDMPVNNYSALVSDEGIQGYIAGKNLNPPLTIPVPIQFAVTAELREREHEDLSQFITPTDRTMGHTIGIITHALQEYGIKIQASQIPFTAQGYHELQNGLQAIPRRQHDTTKTTRLSAIQEFSNMVAYQTGLQLWLASKGIKDVMPITLAANPDKLQGFKDALEGNDERYGRSGDDYTLTTTNPETGERVPTTSVTIRDSAEGIKLDTPEKQYDYGYALGITRRPIAIAPDQGPHSGAQQLILDAIRKPTLRYDPKK